ncbi:MAG: sigma-70 family RNA polymerase sigma factor [Verrucomicrobiales bacterium]|nr:sigma-70 family RNA polymerase sigma factor [Verrucomicrobiales bacterium]
MSSVETTSPFPETRWTLILRARSSVGGQEAEAALNELCTAYWQPLYMYLRRLGLDPEHAQDTVQGFLGHLLRSQGLERAEAPRGRFRNYLITALRNYLVSEHRRVHAAKRAGTAEHIPLDAQPAESVFLALLSETPSPEAAFDRQWAQTIWTQALARLRAEHQRRGRLPVFETLAPHLTDAAGESHTALAGQLGLSTNGVAIQLFRMRRRLRELVLEEIETTVGSDADLQQELAHFLSLWAP